MKQTIYHNNNYTTNIPTTPDIIPEQTRTNLSSIHTQIVADYLTNRKHNKITNTTPLTIHKSEKSLPRRTRTRLAQLRTGKSPILQAYLHNIHPELHTPQCPLCGHNTHDTQHIFHCTNIPTRLDTTSLWTCPVEAAEVVDLWEAALQGLR